MTTSLPKKLARTVLLGALALGACDTATSQYERERAVSDSLLTEARAEVDSLEASKLPDGRAQQARIYLRDAHNDIVKTLTLITARTENHQTISVREITESYKQLEDVNRNAIGDIIGAKGFRKEGEEARDIRDRTERAIQSGTLEPAEKAKLHTIALRADSIVQNVGDYDGDRLRGLASDLEEIRTSPTAIPDILFGTTAIYNSLKQTMRSEDTRAAVDSAYKDVQERAKGKDIMDTRGAAERFRDLSMIISMDYNLEARYAWTELTLDPATRKLTPHFYARVKPVPTPKDEKYGYLVQDESTVEIRKSAFDALTILGYTRLGDVDARAKKVAVIKHKPAGFLKPIEPLKPVDY